jgi:hypothetical protein
MQIMSPGRKFVIKCHDANGGAYKKNGMQLPKKKTTKQNGELQPGNMIGTSDYVLDI